MTTEYQPQFSERTQGDWNRLADEIEEINKSTNNGRGSVNAKHLINYLRSGLIEEAKAAYFNDGDKYYQFEELKELLDRELPPPEIYRSR